jgi:hypothetical protein
MVIEACRAVLTERCRLMRKQRGRQHTHGRMTTSGSRRTLYLPRTWPWEEQFNTILNRLRSIPRPVVCLRA